MSSTTPTTISRPVLEISSVLLAARLAAPAAEDQVHQPGQDGHQAQEQRADQGDARQHPVQVPLGVLPGPNARDEAALPLQGLGQVLLAEHHVGVEVGEPDDQDEVQDPVPV